MAWRCALFAFVLAFCLFGQPAAELPGRSHEQPGPARQISSGVGTIGLGAARGAGHLALGTAKGVGKLATLHPADAGLSVARGAGAAGKDVTVGTAKGTARIGKGIGREFKKVL